MTTTPNPSPPDRLGDDIIRVSSTEWFVRSRRSTPGAYWRVQTGDLRQPLCTCPHGRTLPTAGDVPLESWRDLPACHHLRVAVAWEIQRDRLAHPRPSFGPPNVSALVD